MSESRYLFTPSLVGTNNNNGFHSPSFLQDFITSLWKITEWGARNIFNGKSGFLSAISLTRWVRSRRRHHLPFFSPSHVLILSWQYLRTKLIVDGPNHCPIGFFNSFSPIVAMLWSEKRASGVSLKYERTYEISLVWLMKGGAYLITNLLIEPSVPFFPFRCFYIRMSKLSWKWIVLCVFTTFFANKQLQQSLGNNHLSCAQHTSPPSIGNIPRI
jgi:hypothetical protein